LISIYFTFSGIFTGAAVSYYAHEVVQEYYNPAVPESPLHLRFEYGYALFIGELSHIILKIKHVTQSLRPYSKSKLELNLKKSNSNDTINFSSVLLSFFLHEPDFRYSSLIYLK